MNSTSSQPAHKLGANRKETARKSRRARNFSESCDIHEDRGTLQSKLARFETTVPRSTTIPRTSSPRRSGSTPPYSGVAGARLLTEHSSGPELHIAHLRLFKEGARHVSVAGTFNDWKPQQTPLQQDGNGAWEIALSLRPGDYEYRFVVDGEWTDDPLCCHHVPNPFGGVNAVLHVHQDD
jgi:hypothetical protein